jgi:hypothetical protein
MSPKCRSARQGSSIFRDGSAEMFFFGRRVSVQYVRPTLPAHPCGHDDSPIAPPPPPPPSPPAPCLLLLPAAIHYLLPTKNLDQVSIHTTRITHITHKVGLPAYTTMHSPALHARTHAPFHLNATSARPPSPSLPLPSHPSNPAPSARARHAAAPRWSCQWWGGASKPRLDAAHICAACNAHVSVFQFHVYTHPSPDPSARPTSKHPEAHQDVRGIRGQGYAIGDPGTSRPYMVPISVVVAAASRHCRQCTHCRRCSHHETG